MNRAPWFVAVIMVLAAGAPVAAGEAHWGSWRASALGHGAGGAALWYGDGSGAWRLEVALAGESDAGPDDLAWQRGDGWTLILSADGRGTLNAWGEPWRAVRARGLPELLAALDGLTPGAARGRCLLRDRWLEAVGPGPEPAPTTLRTRMTGRGRGGGGPGEAVWMAMDATGASVLESSRRPGRLILDPAPEPLPIVDSDEIFAPLWPVGEFLDTGSETGTSGAPGR